MALPSTAPLGSVLNPTGEQPPAAEKSILSAGAETETARIQQLLLALVRVLVPVTALIYFQLIFSKNPIAVFTVVTLALSIELGAWALARRGNVRLGSWLLVCGLWLLVTTALFTAEIAGNAPWITLTLVMLVTGLLLGGRAALGLAGLSAVAGFIYLSRAAQTGSWIDPPLLTFNPTAVWIVYSVVFFGIAGLVQLANRSVRTALDRANQSAAAFAQTNIELEEARRSLETEIAARTQDLQTRTHYLQTVVNISRAAASMLDADRLIQTAVEMIRQDFDLYYVGLFAVDPSGEWAVLQAGTGEAGQKMLARGHRIRVGRGMIGWSIANAQPRVALDVGRDAVRLITTELPETRSEAATPLRSRGQVLGALTVQSTRPEAFGEVEINIFQSLADQIAIAIENAAMVDESRRSLEEARRAGTQSGRQAWQDFLHAVGSQTLRCRFGRVEADPAADPGSAAGRQAQHQAVRTGRPVQFLSDAGGGLQRATLALPIPVRSGVIGAIRFVKETSAVSGSSPSGLTTAPPSWQEDEIELLQTIVEQLGIALDSSRLYSDTRRHAFREQLAGEVTSRIRQTLDIQTMLRTAVEEIQRSLNLPEVAVSLTPPVGDGGSTHVS